MASAWWETDRNRCQAHASPEHPGKCQGCMFHLGFYSSPVGLPTIQDALVSEHNRWLMSECAGTIEAHRERIRNAEANIATLREQIERTERV